MADNIAHLRPANPRGVVQICTEMLGMATRDELRSICVVYLHQDGDIGYASSGTDAFYRMVGGLEHLKFEMLAEKTERGD